MNFKSIENLSLCKEFEKISVRFERDRLNAFLGKENDQSSLFASGKGFYLNDRSKRRSNQNFMNNTFGGRFSNVGELKNSNFSRFGINKENARNSHNLIHPYITLKNYDNYNGMKYKDFVQRNSNGQGFSERNLLLEMQK